MAVDKDRRLYLQDVDLPVQIYEINRLDNGRPSSLLTGLGTNYYNCSKLT